LEIVSFDPSSKGNIGEYSRLGLKKNGYFPIVPSFILKTDKHTMLRISVFNSLDLPVMTEKPLLMFHIFLLLQINHFKVRD